MHLNVGRKLSAGVQKAAKPHASMFTCGCRVSSSSAARRGTLRSVVKRTTVAHASASFRASS